MARKKKDGRRANGVHAKKGMLYIIKTQNVIKNGKTVNEKKWIPTRLRDTQENVKVAQKMREQMIPLSSPHLINRDITVPEYVDVFLNRKKRTVTDTTYAGYYNRSLRMKRYFNTIKVSDVSTANVEAFLDDLFTDGCRPRTVKDLKVLFTAIMDMAVNDLLITENPVKEATINKSLSIKATKPKNDDDFFSYKEALTFLSLSTSHPLHELFYTTLFFGLRREEVLGLKWDAIDFNNKELRIQHTVTKGTVINRVNSTKTESSARTYPLSDEHIQTFRLLKEKEEENRLLFGSAYQDNDYIFKHQDGTLYYPDYPTKAFKKLIAAHKNLPQGITFHGLRTSCVSILVHQGFDVKSIQKWVGHADINTTLKIYAKVKEKEAKEEILKGMDELMNPKKYESTSDRSEDS